MSRGGMVVLAANQIWYTWEVEDVFNKMKLGDKHAMKRFNKKLLSQLNDMVVRVRGLLPPLVLRKLETAMILEVHAKDVVESFVRDR
ncbi:unnamed protein product [Protopolystoma xenopodis]|uniref:Uncharacterized protein n=1 Tax=Protopolystoma xenopodis TaxID=117903 RepID=A0A3S5A3M6_9PLAT|nr:unnamed protein product [Protopolystoma xenopodis]